MARPLRIQYPNAWYHVMNRGRRRESIYLAKSDYLSFLKIVKKASTMFSIHIAGYCLMKNHYHILLQTPLANLPRCMRHIDGVYTQEFNRQHRLDGQLFRGRYKSILIQEDGHLLEILRYIHRNALKTGLEKQLGDYPWSTYRAYLTDSSDWEWLKRDTISSMFGKSTMSWNYKEFMAKESPEEVSKIFSGDKPRVIFGSDQFIEKIKRLFPKGAILTEIPESKFFVFKIDKIIHAVCDCYGVNQEELFISRRGIINEPRGMTVFLLRNLRGDSLQTIADYFGIIKYSSVSSIVTRFQQHLDKDKDLQKKHDEILDRIKSR